jgi:hypothetical protein
MSRYPKVKDPGKIGSYHTTVPSGGGYVWDDVLEYRVWCRLKDGAPDLVNGKDYFYGFETYEQASMFSKENAGSEEPVALVLQGEYIDEPEPEKYVHVKEQRIAEWPVELLSRPPRNERTIPEFFANLLREGDSLLGI